jgi:hypothetical protein
VGTSVPLDPGPHELAAEAQGKKPWTTRVEPREGATLEVSIPALEDAAALTPPVAPPAPPPVEPAAAVPSEKPATPPIEPIVTTPQRRRVDWHVPTAIAAAGAGVIALGFGTALGITAINEWAAARPGCPGNNCTPPAAAEWSSAHNAGVASTVSFVAGGVLVAGGAAVWFTRVDAPASVGVRPDGAVVVAGRWP